MGMRNAVVRRIGLPDMTTTVLTLTLTALAAESSLAGGNNSGWQHRVAAVVLMFVGAAAGVVLLRHSLALPLAASSPIAAGCPLAVVFVDGSVSVNRPAGEQTRHNGAS